MGQREELSLNGARMLPGWLDGAAQAGIVADVRKVVAAAPLFHPETRRGKQMSVRMTSAGQVGWISDRRGYRYAGIHPSGVPWPEIPANILDVWGKVTGAEQLPDCCLVNFYNADARMGLHQDRDEASFNWPVVSISLGDDALFRIGGAEQGGKTQSAWLRSGDIVVLEGSSRLAYHGVDRIRAGSSMLLPKGGRINLTMRVALWCTRRQLCG